jgi:hypothetical protein
MIDPKLNLPVPSDADLGPILTQRPETAGRHKLYFAGVYQFFRFEDLDGISLKRFPVVATVPATSTTPLLGFDTSNRLSLTVHQITGYFTFGLTSRVDLSVAVPILDVQEQFISSGTKYTITSNPTNTLTSSIGATGTACPSSIPCVNSVGGATGIGDVVLAAKGTIWKPTYGGLAAGVEIRLPTGDSLNFLGAGTAGVKPYAAFGYGKRVSVHADVGYQINFYSKLVILMGKSAFRTGYSSRKGWIGAPGNG